MRDGEPPSGMSCTCKHTRGTRIEGQRCHQAKKNHSRVIPKVEYLCFSAQGSIEGPQLKFIEELLFPELPANFLAFLLPFTCFFMAEGVGDLASLEPTPPVVKSSSVAIDGLNGPFPQL